MRLVSLCMCVCSVAQLCLTLCDHMDYSPLGSFVHWIFQAGILEWVAISYSWNLPKLGIKPASHVSPALAGGFFTTEPPGESNVLIKKRNLDTDAYTRESAMCRWRQRLEWCFYSVEMPNTACKSSEATKETWHSFFLRALKRNSVDTLEFLATRLKISPA